MSNNNTHGTDSQIAAEKMMVNCPNCQSEVEWNLNNIYRPFCSKKCQLIDFGSWANEDNIITSGIDISDSDGWSELNQ